MHHSPCAMDSADADNKGDKSPDVIPHSSSELTEDQLKILSLRALVDVFICKTVEELEKVNLYMLSMDDSITEELCKYIGFEIAGTSVNLSSLHIRVDLLDPHDPCEARDLSESPSERPHDPSEPTNKSTDAIKQQIFDWMMDRILQHPRYASHV